VEDLFARLPIGDLWHPAIGALFLGIIGFFVPRVLGVGYDTISDILNNQLTLKLLLLIAIFKSLALVLSLGSGTSGGLLAPMFMGGAALGGVYAMVVNRLIPSAHLAPGAYALVAMAAVFGAASRATFALIIFAFEITHDYNAVLPLMLVCVIADFVALRYLPNSIMTEKLARRGLHTHAEYEANVLKQVKVGEVMAQDVDTVPATMSVHDLADRIAQDDPRFTRHRGLLITDVQGHLVGIVTRGDILRALQKDPRGDAHVEDVGTKLLVVSFPDETVFDALSKMLQNNIGRLPVVERADPQKLVGYLGRAGVLASWGRHLEDESLREHGWLKRLRQRNSA
jgi:CBS domain-containing protein